MGKCESDITFGDDIRSFISFRLINLPLDKMATISQMIFSDAFSLMEVLYFDFTAVCSEGSNWHQ